MEWSEWTRRLSELFFQESSAGVEVRLRVTRDVLDGEMPDLGGVEGFKLVLQCPPVSLGEDVLLVERGLELLRSPKLRPRDYPTYLPYLCMLCLAWDEEYEGHANDFYGRLASLYPNHCLDQQLDGRTALAKWDELWEGLARWANRTMEGRFGTFNPGVIGHAYVGKPRYQMILTSRWVAGLPVLFWRSGVAPQDVDQIASPNGLPEFVQRIRSYAIEHGATCQATIGRHVQTILAEPIGGKGLEALGAILGTFLSEWDGRRPQMLVGTISSSGSTSGGGSPVSILAENSQGITPKLALHLTSGSAAFSPRICVETDCMTAEWALTVDAEVHPFIPQAAGLGLADVLIPTSWWDGGPVTLSRDGVSLVVTIPAKPLRLFQWFSHDLMMECHEMPPAGAVLAVVHQRQLANWNLWILTVRQGCGLQIVPCATVGLAPDWQGTWLIGVEDLGMELLKTLPDGQEPAQRRSRMMRLEGGTKSCRSGYFPFDLPDLVVQAPAEHGVSFPPNVVAEAVEIFEHLVEEREATAGELPRTYPIRYRLGEAPNGVHAIKLMRGGVAVETIVLRVQMPMNHEFARGVIFMDPWGRNAAQGARGVLLSHAEAGAN